MGGSSKDGVIDRIRNPNDPHDHHKYDGGRQKHERWLYSTKGERMKDQESRGHGSSSRRNDDVAVVSSLPSSPIRFYHQKSSRVSQDGTLVSLRGLLGRAP